jgi:hypothetical protein
MLKYLIAHLLSGDAKRFHLALARELSVRYHTRPLYERIPPHVTVKPPFETDEAGIAEVERVLRALAVHERAPRLAFSGFGRFGFRTVYMDIVKSADAVSFARRAIKTLNENIAWMPRFPLEGNKLHASVARFLTRRQSGRIWRHLKTMGKPAFESSLDNLAILKKDGKSWTLHALVALPAVREEGAIGYFMPEHAFFSEA